MSTPYTTQDARNILEAFVTEFLVDVPSAGTRPHPHPAVLEQDLLFSESDLILHTFYAADEDWFADIAAYASEAHEEG